MTGLIASWIETANDPNGDFPVNNLPCGVFSGNDEQRTCGVAIGDLIVNLKVLEAEGLVTANGTLSGSDWNAFMALGDEYWERLRYQLTDLLRLGGSDALASSDDLQNRALVAQRDAALHIPITVAEFTDFYAGRHHAENVGTMFRGPDNALPPNWLHIPIGYNGRASSVFVSGTNVQRPWGQLKDAGDEMPRFGPCQRFDFELEIGAVVGTPSTGPISVSQADANIFGYVLLNDWSARDIQAFEYQPLGPFQSKATATSISPWIVTKAALEPFRVPTPERETPLLAYLKEPGPLLYDIDLEVSLQPVGARASTIARTNYREMYYASAQQLAHHTTSGCPMRTGDLLGSGTISGPERENRGSLLELSWGGKEPLELEHGGTRCFLQDGDTVTMSGGANGEGYRIGFGHCVGTVTAAPGDPYNT